jgi:hypothetical protein
MIESLGMAREGNHEMMNLRLHCDSLLLAAVFSDPGAATAGNLLVNADFAASPLSS